MDETKKIKNSFQKTQKKNQKNTLQPQKKEGKKKIRKIIIITIIFIALIVGGFLGFKEIKKNNPEGGFFSNKKTPEINIEPGKVVETEVLEENVPDSAEVIAQGKFVNVEQILEGKALFIESNGERYLRFENFKVVNGQDLHVYLSPILNLDKSDVVDLGLLRSISGNFNYPLDKKLDIKKYANVIIWSNTFNAFFGYASLINKELPPETPIEENTQTTTENPPAETTPPTENETTESTKQQPEETTSENNQETTSQTETENITETQTPQPLPENQ